MSSLYTDTMNNSNTSAATNAQTNSNKSNTGSSNSKKSRTNKGPSCHHCRRNHIGCDGERPCANCVRKKRPCFDYDKSLIKSKPRTSPHPKTSSSSLTTSSNTTTSDGGSPPVPIHSNIASGAPLLGQQTNNTHPHHHHHSVTQLSSNSNIGNSSLLSTTPNMSSLISTGSYPTDIAMKLENNGDIVAYDTMKSELDVTRDQLKQTEQDIAELKRQNQLLIQMLTTQRQHHQQQLITAQSAQVQFFSGDNGPRTEFEMQMWDPPQDLRKPVYVLDTSTFKIVGCNEAFRTLSGYSLSDLQNLSDIFQIMPERFRGPWRIMVQWLLCSTVKVLQGNVIFLFKDNREVCLRLKTHFERSFLWVEVEYCDYFGDEYVIDDIHLPETFHIPYNPAVSHLLVTPTQSFQRLLNVLFNLKRKAISADQENKHEQSFRMLQSLQADLINNGGGSGGSVYDRNETTTNSTSPDTLVTQAASALMAEDRAPSLFKPIELQEEEIQGIASRYSGLKEPYPSTSSTPYGYQQQQQQPPQAMPTTSTSASHIPSNPQATTSLGPQVITEPITTPIVSASSSSSSEHHHHHHHHHHNMQQLPQQQQQQQQRHQPATEQNSQYKFLFM